MDLSMLDGCPLFYELYDKEIQRVVQDAQVITFEDNDVIVKEGDEGEEIFILLEGEVDVTKLIDGGVVKHLVTLPKGSVFGEMVLIDEKVRAASIISRGLTHVLEVKFNRLLALYNSEPKIFGVILLNLARMVAQRLRHANNELKRVRSNNG